MSSSAKKFFLFIGALMFVLFISNGSNTYASLQETGHMGKDMPADTGMTHKDMSQTSHGDMKGMMGEMRDSMMNVQKTGDPDEDFAAMMIQHHKGAIRMSQREVQQGKDKKVISMAEKAIKDQQNEIKDLQKFVKTDQSAAGTYRPKHEMPIGRGRDTSMQHGKDMHQMTGSGQHRMMDKMQNMQMTGDQDNDYVSMMIMHHQHAVDMANEYLDKGKDKELISMAKKMIKENQNQIRDLEDWKMNKSK